MPWPVHPTGFFGARGDQDTYRIERSLRFNSADSAFLNRTFSSGNRRLWTWSGWIKRTTLGTIQRFFTCRTASNDNDSGEIGFADDAIQVSGWGTVWRKSSALLRDPSSWYHFVVTIDTANATANNRIRVYLNGVELTSFSTLNNPSQNADLGINQAAAHRLGVADYGDYANFYLAEVNFIDGQALTPSSFGETDAITGRWKAKAYSGTYGTNGFYLKFADNSGTTATTLGKDSSGNGNNWTPNNFSVTAGAGNDSLVDSPTNYGTDSGVGGEVRGNYPTWNPLEAGGNGTFSDGNLLATAANLGSTANPVHSSFSFPASGKWYCEVTGVSVGSQTTGIGIALNTSKARDTNSSYYAPLGNKYINGTNTSYGASWTNNDIIGIALNMDAGTVVMYKNNVSQGTLNSGLSGQYDLVLAGGGAQTIQCYVNFGQRPFAYTAPAGFKALCTTNLPQPTVQKPSKYMDVVAYTGTGASNSISSLGFSPDLVWIKNRGTTTSHAIYDTTRGSQNQLSSDTTGDAVTSSTGLTDFGSNGFTLGTSSLVNTSGTQYVAWSWDEAPIAGLDIVSYTGNGANRTIAHNLGVAPKMIIVKARTTAGADQGWPVYHASLANTQYLLLNSTAAAATGADYWNSTSPTSSVFSLGTNAAVNLNNDTYIAYLFAEVEGFSKFGSWSGNASTDGPFIWCGFRPKYVIAKRDAAGKPWMVYDSGRSDRNSNSLELRPNTNEAENASLSGEIDFLSNGFKIRSDSGKWIGELGTFIFAAFAESPFKYARAR